MAKENGGGAVNNAEPDQFNHACDVESMRKLYEDLDKMTEAERRTFLFGQMVDPLDPEDAHLTSSELKDKRRRRVVSGRALRNHPEIVKLAKEWSSE
jgi:hypothetical protein